LCWLSSVLPLQSDIVLLAIIKDGGRSSAVCRLKENKAPGADNVTAEEIQAAGEAGIDALFELWKKIWDEEVFPKIWNKSMSQFTRNMTSSRVTTIEVSIFCQTVRKSRG